MISKTALTYGGALYDLAREESLEEQILGELHAVSDLFRQNPDYGRLLMEPSIEKQEREKLIDEAWGGSVHPYTQNFMKLLCDNGTISALPDCFQAFRSRYNRDHNIIDVRAVSAVPMTEAQTKRLREKLEKTLGKKVELTLRTDPSMLGGVRLEMEGERLDGSVRARLDGIRAALPDQQLDGSVQSHLSQIQQLLESSAL